MITALAGQSLKRRLLITAISFLVLLSIASAALFYTAVSFNYYLERSARAQHVYASYRAVSDHTHRKLSALGEIVEEGTLTNLEERFRNKEALRKALQAVRESIQAELIHVGDVKEIEELAHFDKIEILAEEIVRGSESVKQAVQNQDLNAARIALAKLRSHEVEGNFITLIDNALSEELREVRESQLMEQDINTILTRLLSLIFLGFLFIGIALLLTTWRSLNRSLNVFEKAASAYHKGTFSYRVTDNIEKEFYDLAKALNAMAAEVELQREKEQLTQDNLASIIDHRTNELKTSNNKLQQASETRKQFLADISHEIRTPLTIIQGEADVALRGEEKSAAQYIDALSRIKEQTTHTTRFVKDLLFVARAEDGKAPINKCSSSITPLVLDICEAFNVIANEKNITIKSNHPSYDLIGNIDPDRIKQVITILLDNALRYSHTGSVINVDIIHQQKNVKITIKDTGIGVTLDEASNVFSRFYRGSAGSGIASGTGLGLPVAKAIVEAHNGKITLNGESDVGTTATIVLPLEAQLSVVN